MSNPGPRLADDAGARARTGSSYSAQKMRWRSDWRGTSRPSRTGTVDPLGRRGSPRRCRRGCPGAPGRSGRAARSKTRDTLTPGQVSMEADADAGASTVRPASLTCATTSPPCSTAVVPISGPSALTSANPCRPACASTSGPVCPVTAARRSTGLAVHRPHRGEHVAPSGGAGEAGLDADDPLQAEQRRVGGDRPRHRKGDGRHLDDRRELGIGHVGRRHLEHVRRGRHRRPD